MSSITEIERRKQFGERLRQLRGSLSQDEVGDKAGMTGSGLSLLENGDREPKLSTLVKLAGALGVSELTLIAAYKGSEPEDPNKDTENSESARQTLNEILNVLLKNIPHRVFAEALLAQDGPEKVQQYLTEAKRRHNERKKG